MPDFVFHGPEIFILPITFLWIAAFIHCIFNKRLRGNEKVAWILFFIFVNWIGALSYFVYWYGFAKLKRSQVVPPMQSSYIPYQQMYTPPEQSYSPYEQGYQPVRTPNPFQASHFFAEREEREEIMSPLYEQPQVMYPEEPI